MSSSSRTKGVATACAVAGLAVSAWLGYRLYKYAQRERSRAALVQQYRFKLLGSPEQLKALRREFIHQLEEGLARDIPLTGQQMLMLPTFVTQLPTGLETGDVYAIDMGGTNFRVMHVVLSTERSKVDHVDMHEVAIPQEVYTGTGTGLFDFLAAELSAFITAHGGCSSMRAGREPVVGFCFSFPTAQTALNAGTLLDWTKGFTCEGVIGADPVELLGQAMARAGRPVRILALLNDAVALLAAHRYLDPTTSVGVIIGTGTNACYVERLERVGKWEGGIALARSSSASGGPTPQTVINIEWGAFESAALPRCTEDWDVDATTAHQGRYMFEKLLSGLYLGEVARRVLLTAAGQTALLGDYGADPNAARLLAVLASPGALTTAHLAAIVEDDTPMLTRTADVLGLALGATTSLVPYSARKVVRALCELVALRSAQLVAMALDAILAYQGWSGATDGPTTVAFDGGVYEKFAAYRSMVRAALQALRGPEEAALIRLELSHDGSGLGAAVLAAAAVAEAEAQAQAEARQPVQSPLASPATAPPAAPAASPPPPPPAPSTPVPSTPALAPQAAVGAVANSPMAPSPATAPSTPSPSEQRLNGDTSSIAPSGLEPPAQARSSSPAGDQVEAAVANRLTAAGNGHASPDAPTHPAASADGQVERGVSPVSPPEEGAGDSDEAQDGEAAVLLSPPSAEGTPSVGGGAKKKRRRRRSKRKSGNGSGTGGGGGKAPV